MLGRHDAARPAGRRDVLRRPVRLGVRAGRVPDGTTRRATRGRRRAGAPGLPAFWAVYVRVEALERTLTDAVAAGGSVLVGPTRFGEEGRAAAIADPAGVAIGLWEPGTRAGAEVVDEPGAWAMSALHTPDVAAAATFYGTMFGWEAEPMPGTPLVRFRLQGHEPPPRWP